MAQRGPAIASRQNRPGSRRPRQAHLSLTERGAERAHHGQSRMRTPYDRLAKETLSAILERAGRVQTETEVVAARQLVDLTYEPDPSKLALLEPFGLLARMVKSGPT